MLSADADDGISRISKRFAQFTKYYISKHSFNGGNMTKLHVNLINSLESLNEPIVPSTTGDGTKVGVVVGLLIMVFI